MCISYVANFLVFACVNMSSINVDSKIPNLSRRKPATGLTMVVKILGEHFRPNGKTCHSNSFPPPLKSKKFPEFPGDMQKSIFDVNSTKPTTRPKPLPNPNHFFHSEVNLSHRKVETFQIDNGSPLVRGSFRFRYGKV